MWVLQALFEEATSVCARATWDMVCRENVWFNWVGHEWHQWCLEHPVAAPTEDVPERPGRLGDAVPDRQGELSEKKAALEKKEFHKRIDATMAGAPKSKYNPGKAGKHKTAKHTVIGAAPVTGS
jgi:hypothetical protein